MERTDITLFLRHHFEGGHPARIEERRKRDRRPYSTRGSQVGLAVCDGHYRHAVARYGGGDENSSIDMGAFVENIGMIQEKTDAHLTIIHHTGKGAARGARQRESGA